MFCDIFRVVGFGFDPKDHFESGPFVLPTPDFFVRLFNTRPDNLMAGSFIIFFLI